MLVCDVVHTLKTVLWHFLCVGNITTDKVETNTSYAGGGGGN